MYHVLLNYDTAHVFRMMLKADCDHFPYTRLTGRSVLSQQDCAFCEVTELVRFRWTSGFEVSKVIYFDLFVGKCVFIMLW
jgi:hypothetical protein